MANTYDKLLTRGTSANLVNTSIEDGKIRFTTDNGKMYVDYVNGALSKRFPITDVIMGNTEAQILNLQNPDDKLYVASDTNKILFYESSAWESVVSSTPVMTYNEYDQLPESKLTDGILRYISDSYGAPVDNTVVGTDYDPARQYAKDDYCVHNGVLNRCISPTGATGTWDESKWSHTSVSEELEYVNRIYTVIFDKDDWVASSVSTDYPFEQTVNVSVSSGTGVFQAMVIPSDGSAFLSDEEKKIYTNMVFDNNQLTAYASEEPAADITVQISKRM